MEKLPVLLFGRLYVGKLKSQHIGPGIVAAGVELHTAFGGFIKHDGSSLHQSYGTEIFIVFHGL